MKLGHTQQSFFHLLDDVLVGLVAPLENRCEFVSLNTNFYLCLAKTTIVKSCFWAKAAFVVSISQTNFGRFSQMSVYRSYFCTNKNRF